MAKYSLEEISEKLKQKDVFKISERVSFENTFRGGGYEDKKGIDITFYCSKGSLRNFDITEGGGFKFTDHLHLQRVHTPYLIFQELAKVLKGVDVPKLENTDDETIYKKFYEDMLSKGEISFKN